jgi:hypothetical protein
MLPRALWALLDAMPADPEEPLYDIPGAMDTVDRLAYTIHKAAKEAAQ